jgi:hypothetical protein
MKAILQWVLRTMMKDQTGVMQTLPKKDLVDFNVAMTAERLMRNGIDPNALKNANQVENAINQIEAPRNVQQGIRNTESAKVFDMTGKKIDPRSKIMGGKQAETEEEILARINEENKKAVKSLKERKKPDVYTLDDYDTTNMSDIKKEIIRTETKLGNLNPTTLDDGSVVRVTEDVDDGAVRVEYESDKNVFEDPVQLQYRKPLPDEGDPRPTAEFTTAESGPVGRRSGPDDFDIEVDEVGGTSIKDLDSDVSKLKEYATGKGPTMKELVQNIKRKDKAKAITEGGDEMIDAVARRQGDYDPFASGGIARMLGE